MTSYHYVIHQNLVRDGQEFNLLSQWRMSYTRVLSYLLLRFAVSPALFGTLGGTRTHKNPRSKRGSCANLHLSQGHKFVPVLFLGWVASARVGLIERVYCGLTDVRAWFESCISAGRAYSILELTNKFGASAKNQTWVSRLSAEHSLIELQRHKIMNAFAKHLLITSRRNHLQMLLFVYEQTHFNWCPITESNRNFMITSQV